MTEADALRLLADKIEAFPKFIRRDVGREGLKPRITRELAELGYGDDDLLVEYVLELTENLRLTVTTYYRGQFDHVG